MDPISAAASIVGLIGAADTIVESLIKFIRSIRGAPNLAQTVLLEVSDVRAALTQLQRYVMGSRAHSRAHGDLVMVDKVIVILCSCLKTFSELEEISESLQPAYKLRPGRMAQWIFKEDKVRRLLIRLQHSKLSLNLMIASMTCSTVEEARASVEQLTTVVKKVLENNQDMSQRMARLEVRTLDYSPSTTATIFDSGETAVAVEALKSSNSDDATCLTIKKASLGSEDTVSDGSDSRPPLFSFSFDDDLNNSRPYTRAMRRSTVWSPRSSVIGTTGWSCLSGLSLADVSEISVINLPMSAYELWNGERYSTSHMENNGVLETIIMELSRTGSGSLSNFKCRQSSEPHVRTMSHLRSIPPTSNHYSPRSGSTSLKPVKKLLKTRGETLVLEGRGRPSISVGDSGIPVATLPRKIALLGASLSGKTTIYNHLQILYGKDFSKADRWHARQWLVNYLIVAFKIAKEDMEFIQTDRGTEMKDAENFKILAEATATGVLNDFYALRCYQGLQSLWKHPTVRSLIMNGDQGPLNENIPYFMDSLKQIFTSAEGLSNDLLLRSRALTSTVEQVTLKIDQRPSQIFDVGGSRSERTKWGQCIKDVDVIIFVAPLTGYCQPLVEDPEMNRMQESLALFKQITMLEEVRALPILLFLTKVDLFRQKMLQTPICDTFPEYSGSLGCVTACNIFADEFAKCDERKKGTLRISVTCAVDLKAFEGSVESIKSLLVAEKSNARAAVSKSANTNPVLEHFATPLKHDLSRPNFGRVKPR